mmetsp:Transcript_9399/g.21372  ORF Transcript_9399/g.21372 Transcript_9399/m.21372 type:complete len:172 (+) Transcript_9399:66-581(+)|eukprot:CAMPEP_0197898700 /NCGR_PEP_ID=MMETSP1439-20131203/44667_1 /TAXON_ID=66791 /ORGANISM="Gonyaulax spinifera, Strain CCMP409" /LENGTH=171 /DNA_ID=CAMNT_0043519445 /DNA_START=64 /DNA_END=579 /DNA_ORIENTATION=+
MGAPPPTDEKLLDILNKSFERGRNPSVKLLGGKIESFDRDGKRLRMSFVGDPTQDNGNGQVMGGFLSAMIDVTVAQAVVVISQLRQTVSTLEQKVSLLAPVRLPKGSAGAALFVDATAVKVGKSVAFFEASLTDEKGTVVARASQTTMLVDVPPPKKKAESGAAGAPPAKL